MFLKLITLKTFRNTKAVIPALSWFLPDPFMISINIHIYVLAGSFPAIKLHNVVPKYESSKVEKFYESSEVEKLTVDKFC